MIGERPRPSFWLAALIVTTAFAYLIGLSWAPIHPHFDEIRFAEQARSIAATGRDLSGRLMPVYFQMDGSVWFHPIGVYLPAIAFKLLPVSVFALRAPTALVGVLDVVLVYLVALRLFRRRDLALLTGALLAITPAHFIHSRMAVDYLLPTPFALAWVLLMLRFFETRSLTLVFVATSMLGIGIYSYIAAIALMPLLLLVSLELLWIERVEWRGLAIAFAGFIWPIVPAALFVMTHPEMLGATLGRYGIGAAELDVFQRARETLTPWFLSDRANLYASFFAPGYLFLTGGGSLVQSTRTAGIFLVLTLPFMLIGFRALLLRYTPASALVLAGVFIPPLAACVVNEQFAVGRAITMVPFVIVMTVFGVQACSAFNVEPRFPRLLIVGSWSIAAVSLAYVIFRLSNGSVSMGAIYSIGLAAVLIVAATTMQRVKRWWPLIVTLLIGCLVQFLMFAGDYFGDYRPRSAFWFGGNLRGAIVRVVEEIDRRPGTPAVLFEQGIPIADWYWRFHLAEIGRGELSPLGQLASRDQMATRTLAPSTLLVLPAGNYDRLVAEQRLDLIATIMDPSDEQSGTPGAEHPSYLLFQAR